MNWRKFYNIGFFFFFTVHLFNSFVSQSDYGEGRGCIARAKRLDQIRQPANIFAIIRIRETLNVKFFECVYKRKENIPVLEEKKSSKAKNKLMNAPNSLSVCPVYSQSSQIGFKCRRVYHQCTQGICILNKWQSIQSSLRKSLRIAKD